MTDDNLRLWRQVEKTNPAHAKQFDKGRFKGTSVNPIYQYEKATEIFGPAGIGWGHEEIEHRIVDGAQKDDTGQTEKVWFCHARVWYVLDGQRGEVSHWGSAPLLSRTRDSGNKTGYWWIDDEAAKKARTNAVSKCLSILGFSADLWKGYFDSKEYIEGRRKEVERELQGQQHEGMVKSLLTKLDTGAGCESDDDRDAMCQWALGDASITFAQVAATEGLPGAVSRGLVAKQVEGVKWPAMLETARREVADIQSK